MMLIEIKLVVAVAKIVKIFYTYAIFAGKLRKKLEIAIPNMAFTHISLLFWLNDSSDIRIVPWRSCSNRRGQANVYWACSRYTCRWDQSYLLPVAGYAPSADGY